MNTDLHSIRSDDRELVTAIAELNSAIKEALRHLSPEKAAALTSAVEHYSLALINRITVISGTDQIDVARLRTEFEELKQAVQAINERTSIRSARIARARREREEGDDLEGGHP